MNQIHWCTYICRYIDVQTYQSAYMHSVSEHVIKLLYVCLQLRHHNLAFLIHLHFPLYE